MKSSQLIIIKCNNDSLSGRCCPKESLFPLIPINFDESDDFQSIPMKLYIFFDDRTKNESNNFLKLFSPVFVGDRRTSSEIIKDHRMSGNRERKKR